MIFRPPPIASQGVPAGVLAPTSTTPAAAPIAGRARAPVNDRRHRLQLGAIARHADAGGGPGASRRVRNCVSRWKSPRTAFRPSAQIR
jgi:hypothetical protein